MTQRCAVIGGGPAGCAAAHSLHASGYETVLFEAGAALGGRTATYRDATRGIVLDTGAGFFTNFYPVMWRLLRQVGLRRDVVSLNRVTALQAGPVEAQLKVGSLGSFARFGHLQRHDRWRMGMHAAAAAWRYRGLKLSDAASLSPHDDTSVAQYARQHVGEAAYQMVVRPGIEPFWYFSCETTSRALLCGLLAHAGTARFFALRGGMDSLCHRLAQHVECRLQASAVDLRPMSDGRWQVVDARGETGLFDAVVVATPASQTSHLVASLAPTWVPQAISTHLAAQSYVPNVHVSFLVPKDRVRRDVNSVFPCGPHDHAAAAVCFNVAKQQGSADGLVSVFLAAKSSAGLLHADAPTVAREAWQAGRRLCPSLPETGELCSLHVRAEAIPRHNVGHYRSAAAAQAAQRGPLAFAGDYLATATVDGALCTGLRAAASVTQYLQQRLKAGTPTRRADSSETRAAPSQ